MFSDSAQCDEWGCYAGGVLQLQLQTPTGLWWPEAPEAGGVQDTPTYILQNDRHVALIILRYACWGQNCFVPKLYASEGGSQQLGWIGGWGGVIFAFKCFAIIFEFPMSIVSTHT